MSVNPAASMEPPSGHSLLNGLLAQRLDGVVTTDADFNILEFSPGAERLCGRTRLDVIGLNWLATIRTEITSANAEAVWQHLEDGREIRADVRIHRPDGSCIDVQVSAGHDGQRVSVARRKAAETPCHCRDVSGSRAAARTDPRTVPN